MKTYLRLVQWATLALVLLCANTAGAMSVLFSEDFETDGDGIRYDLVGGGGGGTSFWGLQSIGSNLGFSGFSGSDFIAGANLDGPFGGGITPRELQLPIAPVDLSGVTDATLEILLGANSNGLWDAGEDYLRIVAIDTVTTNEFVLELFLPNADGNLESLAGGQNPGTVLDLTLLNLVFTLPTEIDMLAIRIEAMSTAGNERLALDDIRVSGSAPVPEPATALLVTLGIAGMLAGRRAGLLAPA